MAKKYGMDDIISGLGDIMPPPLSKTDKTAEDGNGGTVRRIPKKQKEKITEDLGEVVAKRSFDNGLIRKIEIKSWGTRYDFYGDFLQKGELYFRHFEPDAEYVHFFSFTPQYGQLNQKQLDYYSLWRHNVRKGKYIQKIDFSYLLLFIYEVINLTPRCISPKVGCNMLANVWKNYRNMFFPLDKYLSEWMCDYCLVHDLPCPHEIIDPFLSDILKKTSFPEFYLNDISGDKVDGAFFESQAEYSYRASKYLNRENREIFDKHIRRALELCTEGRYERSFREVVRDSYMGALCLDTVKRRMSISYISISEGISETDSAQATKAVKYAENMVRMGLGISGRHKDADLPDDMRRKIDSYFAHNFLTGDKADKLKMELADYKYQPVSRGFSPEAAEKIEEESRAVIDILEVDDGQQDVQEQDAAAEALVSIPEQTPPEPQAQETGMEECTLDPLFKEALLLIYKGEHDELVRFAISNGTLPEALADEINYYSFLTIEDLVLEEREGKYEIFPEYVEVVKAWLKIK